MTNTEGPKGRDNVIPFRLKGRPGMATTGEIPLGGDNPPGPPKLPQDDYVFVTRNPVTGEEIIREKTGHLVVTQQNIVLFNEDQEMVWGIPNDSSLVEFERLDFDDFQDIVSEATEELVEE